MAESVVKISVDCPACGQRYQVATSMIGRQGRCKCGTVIPIQALAAAPVAGEDTAAPVTVASPGIRKCTWHADTPAQFACAQCSRFICSLCDFQQVDGSHLCPDCASHVPQSLHTPNRSTLQQPLVMPILGTMCRVHPSNPAVTYCQRCQAPVCDTCAFVFPNQVRLCPTCATNTQVKLSGYRWVRIVWSLGLAGWSTLTLVGIIVVVGIMEDEMTQEGQMALGFALMAFSLLPAIVGAALGFGALDRHRGNTPLIWVAAFWNTVLLVVWMLMTLIGNLSG